MSEPSNAQPIAAAADDERPSPAAALRIDRPHAPAGVNPGAEAARQGAFPARTVPVHTAA